MTAKERQDSFRTLQKFLAEEITDWRPASGPTPIPKATQSILQRLNCVMELVRREKVEAGTLKKATRHDILSELPTTMASILSSVSVTSSRGPAMMTAIVR